MSTLTDEELQAIKARAAIGLELINPIDPHVTAKGGIVLLYGPYPINRAEAIVNYYRQLNTDVPALLSEIARLREENKMLQIAVNEWASRATGLKNDLDEIAEEIRELES
jgi:hypothetical protein